MNVYFISQKCEFGITKVGKAANVTSRLSALQTANPVDLEISGVIPCDSDDHACRVERKIHSALKRNKVRGEWFAGVNPESFGAVEFDSVFDRETKKQDDKLKFSTTENNLSEFIRCGDGKATNFLAYLLEHKTDENIIHGTQRELSEKSGVSLGVITRTINALTKKNLMKKIRSGTYMLSPKIIRNGDNLRGAIMFRTWDAAK